MITLYIVLLIFIYFLTKYVLLPYKSYRFYLKYGKGKFFPIIGEILLFINSEKKYGNADYMYHHIHDQGDNQKVFVCNLGLKAKLVLIEPEIVKDFFLKQQECYIKDQFLFLNMKRFMQDGIISTEGQKWKTSRKIFSKAFNFDYLQGLSASIQEVALIKFKQMISQKQHKSVNTIECMQAITGSVVILSFFGETLSDLKIEDLSITQALAYILNTLSCETFSIPFLLFGKRFYSIGFTKETRKFNVFLGKMKEFIESHLNKKISEIEDEIKSTGKTTNKSILAELIVSKQIYEISREQLYYEFTTFYLAGMDTTGHLLGMLIYYISQDKEIYQTLQKEIDTNKDSSPSKLASLPYLNAVIKEGLRYYGPGNVLFDRIAIKDHVLGGIPIKKGTLVNPYAISFHRDSKYFEDPHRFNPQRWIGKTDSDIVPYSYIPFSAGARNCIGQHLALLEARIILNLFIQTFDFECPDDYKLKMAYQFLLEPIDPLRIKLSRRKNQ